VIFPTAPRRPSRVAAAALLLILHLAAIELFLNLRTTREQSAERLVTLLLTAFTKPAPTPPKPVAKPVRAPHARLALPPVPAVDPEPLRSIHDSATAIAAPGTDTGVAAAGNAASGAASAPLNLAIPKDFFAHPPKLTPAQEAMQDPRSNRLVLTRQEQLDVDFGVFECIAWQREPDGSIYRGPGHYQRIQGISTNPFTKHSPGKDDRGQECVK
jgi:hypothetical protein